MLHSRFNDQGGSGDGIAFRDVLFGMVGVLAAVVVILLLLPKNPKEADDYAERSRGNIRVELIWPSDYDVDIDLWGKAPGLPSVGYTNQSGPVLNLVRDDLGHHADVGDANYEIMFARGLPQGEWTFNVHWFGNTDRKTQVPIEVLITITYDDADDSTATPPVVIKSSKVVLTSMKQERTIFRFRIGSDGKLDKDSITTIYKPIRSAAN